MKTNAFFDAVESAFELIHQTTIQPSCRRAVVGSEWAYASGIAGYD